MKVYLYVVTNPLYRLLVIIVVFVRYANVVKKVYYPGSQSLWTTQRKETQHYLHIGFCTHTSTTQLLSLRNGTNLSRWGYASKITYVKKTTCGGGWEKLGRVNCLERQMESEKMCIEIHYVLLDFFPLEKILLNKILVGKNGFRV